MAILIISFTVSFLVLIGLLKTNLANIALDAPNHRSLHTALTPRTGGLAIMLGVLIAFAVLGALWVWIGIVAGFMLVSLMDDVHGLQVRWRLATQLLLCVGFVWLFMHQQPWWVLLFAVLALVWMSNLYNFMDGSDGLAGGMGLFGFSTYALASYTAGDMQLAMMSASVSASCLAFLFFNFYPAKIFMGDAGSIPLGFLAGAIGLYGWQHALWPIWLPVLVFSPFIVDATITLLKRALRREKVWQAHREHYYQRLIQMGWGHKKTATAECTLMFSIGICALTMLKLSYLWVILLLLLWLFFYFFIMLKIDKLWKQRLP